MEHKKIHTNPKDTYNILNLVSTSLGSEELMNHKILTNRETQVFSLLVKNKTTKEIAKELKISEKTVRNHISNTMQKLGVKGRAQAVVELIRLGNIKL